MAALLVCSFAFSSCSDMDKYFETPDWIKGSIYEELTNDGNYGIFLKGVDLAGYQPILNGKSILTVMAPTDEAMSAYISQHYGKSSIEELSTEEIKKLIGFHILYYSFDKNKLINFRPQEGDGATDEEKLVNAGLYYKFRTKSQDPISIEHNVTDSSTYDVSVYHLERYLPVYSYMMFRTKGIDAKGNYEYFYPETGWKGDGGFNVSNASVTEYETIAKNGYIYKIDRVLKPLETIYKEMSSAGKYGKFLSF
ncbi:MAG: fasciclin domain-containing protein, partial [Prevotella sp.]|nr:fasciclin domain-containing protein [Prevotella sp.]